LLRWFQENKRDLPFRNIQDSYKIWVSEVMAQQTRITAMVPLYLRFTERFPTVASLAQAPEADVLAMWSGAGYYSRARNLSRTAKIVMEQYKGELPNSREALLTLPGIGPYIAGAIASIAFSLPEPAVDGNVIRVYSRLLATQNIENAPDFVRSLMKDAPPGQITESLMELGALICLPKTPLCSSCPWKARCRSFLESRVSEFPPKRNLGQKQEEFLIFLRWMPLDNVVLMRQETGSLLHGLWLLPTQEQMDFSDSWVRGKLVAKSKHVFTHKIWQMTCYEADGELPLLPPGFRLVGIHDYEKFAIPSAMRPFLP
jgi:A/G-specific adenine glycosylase